MAIYAIGDVQGCHTELQRLLDAIGWHPLQDRLWFTGDLINRGPDSLAVLRFVRGLGDRAVTVLGNHDLHFVAAAVSGQVRPNDTFQDVLAAPDRAELLQWLRTRPLAHHEAGYLLIHAGVAPQWDLAQTLACAREAEALVADPRRDPFLLHHMYGDQPDRWSAALRGHERLRFIINCFTRLRFCTPEGRVELSRKGPPAQSPDLLPWFAVPVRGSAGVPILFGHWSLLGRVDWPAHEVYGLDTGCVWGRQLSALRLEDQKLFSVQAARAYGQE